MKRREFIGLVGGAAALPLVARAQNSRPRKVGILFPGVLGADRERLITEGLTSELGSEKVILLARSAEGDDRLLAKYANELAASMDVILAIASGSLAAARQASQTVPIVALDLESDPIATGAAKSLTRPGGMGTGLSSMRLKLQANGFRLSGRYCPRSGRSRCFTIRIWIRRSSNLAKTPPATSELKHCGWGSINPVNFAAHSRALLKQKWTRCSCTRRPYLLIRPPSSPNSVANSDCHQSDCSQSMQRSAV